MRYAWGIFFMKVLVGGARTGAFMREKKVLPNPEKNLKFI